MNILLVEDEAPKLAHIERFILSLVPTATLRTARSVNAAIDAIEDDCPNLLIIDMSLPTFEVGDRETGGRPQPFGGVEILRHLTLSATVCPTIVLTGYEGFKREVGNTVDLSQLGDELTREFPESFRGVLHYNSTFDEWKNQLAAVFTDSDFVKGGSSENSGGR